MDKIQKTKIWDLWDVNNKHRLGREVKVCRNTSDIFLVLFLFFFSLLPGFYQDTKPSWGIVQQAQAAKTSRISPSDRNARKRNTWSHRVGGSFQWFLFLTSLPWGQYQLLNCTATAEAEVSKTPRENPSLCIKGPGKGPLFCRVLIIFVIAFFSLFSCCFFLKQARSHWTVDLCRWLQLRELYFQPEEQRDLGVWGVHRLGMIQRITLYELTQTPGSASNCSCVEHTQRSIVKTLPLDI